MFQSKISNIKLYLLSLKWNFKYFYNISYEKNKQLLINFKGYKRLYTYLLFTRLFDCKDDIVQTNFNLDLNANINSAYYLTNAGALGCYLDDIHLNQY